MRALLGSTDVPAFLDSVAQEELAAAREVFAELRPGAMHMIPWVGATVLLHWEGTVEANTLALRLVAEAGTEVQSSQHAIEIDGAGPERVAHELERIGEGRGLMSAIDLARRASDLVRGKFDGLLPLDLPAEAYVTTRIDGAWRPTP